MDTVNSADNTRERIVAAAVRLLAEGGREAVSTRAVSAAADVQAPTLYRLFGDKQGLLDAVAVHGFTTYLSSKEALEPGDDPVEDLRTGWNLHVEFALDNPALYSLMYAESRGSSSPAAITAAEILAGFIHRIAEAGRLRVSEERAAHFVHSTSLGMLLTLLGMPEGHRDPGLADMAREVAIAAITTDAPAPAPSGAANAAITLRAVLPQTSALTASEQALMREWLERIANG